LQNPVGCNWFSCSWNQLGSDLCSSPRGFRQLCANDFRRAGKNNRALKSQSLQNAEQSFKQVDAAQFGQRIGRIPD